jgi:ABC-type enterochelin transport system permease subunit
VSIPGHLPRFDVLIVFVVFVVVVVIVTVVVFVEVVVFVGVIVDIIIEQETADDARANVVRCHEADSVAGLASAAGGFALSRFGGGYVVQK